MTLPQQRRSRYVIDLMVNLQTEVLKYLVHYALKYLMPQSTLLVFCSSPFVLKRLTGICLSKAALTTVISMIHKLSATLNIKIYKEFSNHQSIHCCQYLISLPQSLSKYRVSQKNAHSSCWNLKGIFGQSVHIRTVIMMKIIL